MSAEECGGAGRKTLSVDGFGGLFKKKKKTLEGSGVTHVTEPNWREKHHGTATFNTNYYKLRRLCRKGTHWKNN